MLPFMPHNRSLLAAVAGDNRWFWGRLYIVTQLICHVDTPGDTVTFPCVNRVTWPLKLFVNNRSYTPAHHVKVPVVAAGMLMVMIPVGPLSVMFELAS